jgi:hypothetical protein
VYAILSTTVVYGSFFSELFSSFRLSHVVSKLKSSYDRSADPAIIPAGFRHSGGRLPLGSLRPTFSAPIHY